MSFAELLTFDRAHAENYIIGVDEVGRGCLAGPLVAVAVRLNLNSTYSSQLSILNDSKQLSPKKREDLLEPILACVDGYHLVSYQASEIDQQGIEPINQLALQEAALGLSPGTTVVLVDGRGIRGSKAIPHTGIIKGDSKSAAIACSSVIAKVSRDQLMIEAAEKYPGYDFENNKGYGTPKHQEGLRKLGLSPLHRRSFCSKYLEEAH